MKIVADENIPLIEHYFGGCGELILKPGREISRKDLMDADILLVRSVTKVNQSLLENTSVKFVGSATSGADHVDTDWLDVNNISWSVAQGCNAIAVAEYVVCIIAVLQKIHLLSHSKIRAAVVGVGRIGQLVAEAFKRLGFEVVLCDPFRTDIKSTPFAELSELDFISFHTPLTTSGNHPTYHLVQKEFLSKQKKNCILLNAGRGEVFSFDQLKKYRERLVWCLDVWEGEPDINIEILTDAMIATPHIAGYSLQSKYRGIEMIYKAALAHGILGNHSVEKVLFPTKKIDVNFAENWRDVVLAILNPLEITFHMKGELTTKKESFDVIRKSYMNRFEFAFIELEKLNLPEQDRSILKSLGFGID